MLKNKRKKATAPGIEDKGGIRKRSFKKKEIEMKVKNWEKGLKKVV